MWLTPVNIHQELINKLKTCLSFEKNKNVDQQMILQG